MSNVAKAVEIPPMGGLAGVPDSVIGAALGGKHHPVVPHRQRLLVAANKTPDIPKEEAAAPKAKPPAKPKAATKPKTAAKAKADSSKAKGNRAPHADTEYNIQRKAFFATFLS